MIDLMKLPAADAERLAYAEGFAGTAELFARLSDAKATVAVLTDALSELVAEADNPQGWAGHPHPNTYGFQLARAALEALK